MKLAELINTKPIPFDVCGVTWYMKSLTIGELQKVRLELLKLEANPEDLSPLMVLFTDVIVDADGELLDEIKEGKSFEEITKELPVMMLQELVLAVSEKLSGNNSGN